MSAPELSQALARRWFQKAENDLLNVEAAYVVRAWVRRALGLDPDLVGSRRRAG